MDGIRHCGGIGRSIVVHSKLLVRLFFNLCECSCCNWSNSSRTPERTVRDAFSEIQCCDNQRLAAGIRQPCLVVDLVVVLENVRLLVFRCDSCFVACVIIYFVCFGFSVTKPEEMEHNFRFLFEFSLFCVCNCSKMSVEC